MLLNDLSGQVKANMDAPTWGSHTEHRKVICDQQKEDTAATNQKEYHNANHK